MSAKKYRKKPVVIEAWQYTGTNHYEIGQWIGGNAIITKDGSLRIRTLEGDMTVSLQDYVIRGVQGEHYPCKPDIFDQTYEEVAE
jgi:hypothetical protein